MLLKFEVDQLVKHVKNCFDQNTNAYFYFSEQTKQHGITVILDARKGPWKIARSCIRQITTTIKADVLTKCIVLRPDAFWDKQRVENCAGGQQDGQVRKIIN